MKHLFFIILAGSLLAACGHNSEEPAAQEEHHEEPADNIAEISLRQMQAAGIVTDTIQMKNLSTSVKASGMLTVPNQNKALVTSVTNGVLKTLLVQPGDLVNKGQIIATIINPEVTGIQQELQTTNVRIELAETEQRRQRELVEGNAAPLKNLQRSETELATLKAVRNALQQQLSTMGLSLAEVNKGKIMTVLSVRAPISGTISEIAAQIGSSVDPSAPIAQIVNNSQLHLDLFVYEKDLSKLKPRQTIHFTVTNNAGKEYDATIYSIGTAFTNDTKTIPVHAVVKGNKAGLIEGMNVTAVISIGKAVVSAVPTEAIVSNGGMDYIFLLKAKSVLGHEDKQSGKNKNEGNVESADESSLYFEKVPIVKGTTDIGFTEIVPVNAIPPGAKVVTKGAFFVMAKITNAGGHEH